MGLILTTFAFVLLGFGVWAGLPTIVGPILPARLRQRMGAIYFQQSASALRRFLIVKRKHAGYTLAPSSYNAERSSEQIELGGETKDYEDEAHAMSRFYKYPFGIALEKWPVIVSPPLCELGETWAQAHNQGNIKVVTDGGDEYYSGVVELDETPRLIDPNAATAIAAGGGDPDIGEVVDEFMKKSQSGYVSTPVMQGMTLFLGFGVTFGAMWLAGNYLGGGSSVSDIGDSVSVPIGQLVIDTLPLVLGVV